MNRGSREEYQVRETTLNDSTMVDIYHCTFAKTHGMYTTKNEP